MIAFDYTFDDPHANLALDEVLLKNAEATNGDDVLRFWESPIPFVVLGLTQRINAEVKIDRCNEAGVPIARRCSAGGCVVQSPGCLNYTLILSKDSHPEIAGIQQSYEYILNKIVRSLPNHHLQRAGISDIVYGDLKVSGSAQRRQKTFILHHGTLLYNADINLVSELLQEPADQPEYRSKRTHGNFITNLNSDRKELVSSILAQFNTTLDKTSPAEALLTESTLLAKSKYSDPAWINRK